MRMTFEDPNAGTELVRVFTGSSAPTTAEVRFEPASSNDTLSGHPSAWCNSPGAGQPLVFNVPVPANPGDPDTQGQLKVTPRSTGVTVEIPIRIKHEA